jgi:hypothetical protein
MLQQVAEEGQIEVAAAPDPVQRLLVPHVAAATAPNRGPADLAALTDEQVAGLERKTRFSSSLRNTS